MLARTVDHLWQSMGVFALAWLLARMLRPNAAAIRLWAWRIAALKFAVPFEWLSALGAWYGFPVRHNALPPPAPLTDVVSSALPFAAPAQYFATDTFLLVIVLLLTLFMSGLYLDIVRPIG